MKPPTTEDERRFYRAIGFSPCPECGRWFDSFSYTDHECSGEED